MEPKKEGQSQLEEDSIFELFGEITDFQNESPYRLNVGTGPFFGPVRAFFGIFACIGPADGPMKAPCGV